MLVEVKSGSALLDADQINAYWDIARREGFDAVLTISNEIAPSPGVHPTEGLKQRANSKVKVHHVSWTRLLTMAVMEKTHRGVEDPEQDWILGELIRYLEHDASGVMDFDDMGPNWTEVR
ncbi:MAG: stress response protein, partial [Acidimicrobiales bacterium]